MQGGLRSRVVYLDCLRIFATFIMIQAHVAAQNWFNADVRGFTWNVFNVYDSFGRCSVSIFAMITGTIYGSQDRSLDLKKLYGKNILRFLTAFFFWSAAYAIIMPVLQTGSLARTETIS